MNAEKLIYVASKTCGNIFDTCGEVLPMYHWINAQGDHSVIGTPFKDQREKEEVVAAMKLMFKADEAVSYVFICEAYSAVCDNAADAHAAVGHVAEHPNAVECVLFQAEDQDGHCLGSMEIIRKAGEKPTLGPLVVTRLNRSEIEGLMTNLLPRTLQ